MKTVRHLSIDYYGELHDVQLINFTVAAEEITPLLPAGIRPLHVEPGRCLISMVNVDLRNMRPFFPAFPFRFGYRHIAFRLLVDDREFSTGKGKGIYFLQSFTNKRWVAWGGSKLTLFKFSAAGIQHNAARTAFRLQNGKQFIRYRVEPGTVEQGKEKLQALVQPIDRAYYVSAGQVKSVKICREQWPLVPVRCTGFATSFFSSARPEGAFVVPQCIYYHWERPTAQARQETIESAVMYW